MKHQFKALRAHFTGAKLLLTLSCILSLAFVSDFVIGLRAADTPGVAAAAVVDDVTLTSPAASVSDIVSAALTFKATLTTAQQAVLEQTYTAALARRWSNLPCTNTCRNGIGLGTLTSDQLTAALSVIKAASGTAANEGYDEFNQIRIADGVLAAQQGTGGGGPGGGGGYGTACITWLFSTLRRPRDRG